MSDEEQVERAEEKMRRISRRSFMWALLAAFGAYGGISWINGRSEDMGIPWPLRRSLDFTDDFTKELLQKNTPEFKDKKLDNPVRINSDIGISEATRDDFKLTVSGAGKDDIEIPMAALLKMPKMTMVTQLNCIEGWTQTVKWAGVSLAAFLAQHPPLDTDGHPMPQGTEGYPRYLQLESEDGAYYIGLDIESALHPQTMLCYEMNDAALPKEHGGPLRLVIPVKYGVKNIKWLGLITYSSDKTKDYWAEQGYDWFAGL